MAACRSTTPSEANYGWRDDDDCSAAEVTGWQAWDDHQREIWQASTSGITRGVANMKVLGDDIFVHCDGAEGEDYAANESECEDDEDGDDKTEICPLGRKRGGSRSRKKVVLPRAGRQGKRVVQDTGVVDATESRDFWTVEHMIGLIRAKRDQDLHLTGLGHNYGRMKSKTWKCDNVETRLMQMGVTSRKAVDYGKQLDNLYQQFKTVHKFMGEFGKQDFFGLTLVERKECGFHFRMD
ncbi:hypothetical protein CBR_g8016 [Chara braunii]|uniref:Myb/SANT-like domain-containing protein n=1 Tax=Chara braunii TaxID=69332 RepID=A0A388KL07_CHABU|nr:hypothetical protein CBR_g8016 [Chara braunii]|eukprot:GBG70717.1 hypothetical protein CBR_g8016 [Chara braunii]